MDNYTLAILPLARLLGEDKRIDRCCTGDGEDGVAYRRVMESGLLGYRLYIYHGLVRTWFGETAEHEVRERHIRMFKHVEDLDHMLTMIDGAVGVGMVITETHMGGVATPVEMNVALALLLGLPESPHYVTRPGHRAEQGALMRCEIDWCFADLLSLGREEIIDVFVPMFGRLYMSCGIDRDRG